MHDELLKVLERGKVRESGFNEMAMQCGDPQVEHSYMS